MEELLTVLQEYKGQLASLQAHLQANPDDQETLEVHNIGSGVATYLIPQQAYFFFVTNLIRSLCCSMVVAACRAHIGLPTRLYHPDAALFYSCTRNSKKHSPALRRHTGIV